MNTDIRVLVVEDDQDLRESVVEYLNLAGLTACGVGSAAECYHTLNAADWSVVVVDIGLPDQSGYVLVEYIRTNSSMRVIILTARDAIDDRVKGYVSGADNYLVKPVDCRELTAAIVSLAHRQIVKTDQPPVLHNAEAWALARSNWTLLAPGEINIALTSKEFQFIQLLTSTPGKAVDRDTLLLKLYLRHDEYTSRSLDSLVRRLRAKIMTATGDSAPIKTAHAVGYCFTAPLSHS